MPPQAYALVSTFILFSILWGVLATRLFRRWGGPRRRLAVVLPVLASFLLFYLVGHKWGIALGPMIELYGFQVAIVSDNAFGLTAALVAAGVQALVVRSRARPA